MNESVRAAWVHGVGATRHVKRNSDSFPPLQWIRWVAGRSLKSVYIKCSSHINNEAMTGQSRDPRALNSLLLLRAGCMYGGCVKPY